MSNLLTLLSSQSTKRTTSLSEGSKLAILIFAICVSGLGFAEPWAARWLLGLGISIVILTFGLWFVREIRGKNTPTEEHREAMAAIGLLGKNRDGATPELKAIEQSLLISNPEVAEPEQEIPRG